MSEGTRAGSGGAAGSVDAALRTLGFLARTGWLGSASRWDGGSADQTLPQFREHMVPLQVDLWGHHLENG